MNVRIMDRKIMEFPFFSWKYLRRLINDNQIKGHIHELDQKNSILDKFKAKAPQMKNLFLSCVRLERIQSGKLKNTFTHVNWKSKHDDAFSLSLSLSSAFLTRGDFCMMRLENQGMKTRRFIMLMVKNYDEQFSIVLKR